MKPYKLLCLYLCFFYCHLSLPTGPFEFYEYEKLIEKSISKGYVIIPVIDWVRNKGIYQNTKVLILRHDVDWDDKNAIRLATYEYKHGARATYYFRWSTAKKKEIEYIKKLKHEIGLHYETLATYAEENNITERQQVTKAVIDTCRLILKNEIIEFENLYGDIATISAHGAERNWMIEVPNYKLMKDQDPLPILDPINWTTV